MTVLRYPLVEIGLYLMVVAVEEGGAVETTFRVAPGGKMREALVAVLPPVDWVNCWL